MNPGEDMGALSAPDWFRHAITQQSQTHWVPVDGIVIEARSWGDVDAPGLMLLHGNGAHLGWWSFLAPFFASDHRVVTFSLSGMGGSGWRDSYSIAQFTREIWAVAETTGIARQDDPPVIVGHSLGGMPALRAAASRAGSIRAVILVDVALPGLGIGAPAPYRGHRIYPSAEAALSRFRLIPPQPCANDWLLDYLGTMAMKEVPGQGWTWRFDPRLWESLSIGDPWRDLVDAAAPIAVVTGMLSNLTGPALIQHMRALLPSSAPFVAIPEAGHHVMADQPLALVSALRALLAGWVR